MSDEIEKITVRHHGQRYRVDRDIAGQDGLTHEYWPQRGVIGSHRKWLGHRYTRRLYWYAAVNPAGQPYQATSRANDLPTRRAAITWLLDNS
ncbi:MAG: hypothetical protein H0T54_06320 [Geodermatophilaceae bacterium]|nr:hypothetical protein [Geodermatophilaceae bacterium]